MHLAMPNPNPFSLQQNEIGLTIPVLLEAMSVGMCVRSFKTPFV